MGWCWGALLIPLPWALANRVWMAAALSLVGMVPLYGWPLWVIAGIWVGIQGHELAWQFRRFDSVAQFRDTMRVWNVVGVWSLAVGFALGVIGYLLLSWFIASATGIPPSYGPFAVVVVVGFIAALFVGAAQLTRMMSRPSPADDVVQAVRPAARTTHEVRRARPRRTEESAAARRAERRTNRTLPIVAGVAVILAATALVIANWGKWVGRRPGTQGTGPDGSEMVWVPPGAFTMGSTDADAINAVTRLGAREDWLDDEKPARRLSMTTGFWIGRYEVTNSQYARFLNEHAVTGASDIQRLIFVGGDTCGIECSGGVYRPKAAREDHPVVAVPWRGARAYVDHFGMRLPTEAQWEYAARGLDAQVFPWGDNWDPSRCSLIRLEGRRYWPTETVGTYPTGASWCGACDMAGSVWEWCEDWYSATYYQSGPSTNPRGPVSGEWRVMRGGGHDAVPAYSRCAYRECDNPQKGRAELLHGFRACSP